ncbi:Gfo/Idh/MocA family protein [Streptomyces hoynatensis]|uniref:Gfo/Idh/MocA family oxidoreductase n=1 Tax=Streptomyces hoynatensis TaxID=1141874 RepID=A0A3A9YVT8_9ACTN|nr:Gfo/Idh/MocA family oxidoreductase [Streptomyces hoynatensis]RKN40115.1 gfo/Idh/MocA family oxidoreductase [Streptomyces hoynatensis]
MSGGNEGQERVRVAVAGLGVIAQTIHLPLLERLSDRFSLTAVADLSPALAARVGARYGIAPEHRHTDVPAMLERGGFDAVLLLTSGSHVRYATAALRRGYRVLSEKPLGFTREEITALSDVPGAERLMVGYMKQYDPAAQRMLRLLQKVGGPQAVHAVDVTVLHPSSASQLAFARLPRPAGDVPPEAVAALRAEEDKLVGTALGEEPAAPVRTLYDITLGSICHELSLIRLFAGTPADVDHVAVWAPPGHAEAAERPQPSVELSGPLPQGGRYAIRWLYLPDYPAYRETVAVHHATGSLELVFPSPYLLNAPTLLTEVGSAEGVERRAEHRGTLGGFEAELLAFHALVTRGTPPLSGVAEGLADVVTAQRAAHRLATRYGLNLTGEAAHA